MTLRRNTIVAALAFGALALPGIVIAQGFGKFIGVEADDIRLIVLRLFQIFWVLVGVACAGVAGYGVYLYRTAKDDLEEEAQGKRFIVIGGIGVIVVIVISIILGNIYSGMSKKTEKEPPASQFEFSSQFFSEMLGKSSKIAEHYPPRDAKNIPRNIRIIIKFKESISVDSIRGANKKLKSDAIRIQQVFPQMKNAPLATAVVEASSDHTIVEIMPDSLLGEKNKKSTFVVMLTNKMRTEKGESLFASSNGYSWQFEISGLVDNTPPQVESALPLPQLSTGQTAERYPYNHMVQITFSKPIDPMSMSGDHISITNNDLKASVLGTPIIGNEFRSISFLPQFSCGKNTCGETIYCLPQKSSFTVAVKAASIPKIRSTDSPNRALFPYDGIIDVTGNSLDGGGINGEKKNGISDGNPADSFSYSFATSDQYIITPPQVTYIQPKRDGTKVDLNAPIQADFNAFMDLNSLHTSSFALSKDLNYWISNKNDIPKRMTTSLLLHDPLKPNTVYKPQIQSGARNILQQCFNPCIGPTP